MRKVLIFCAIIISITLSSTVFAEQPHYTIKRASGTILIDGILDEEDWAAAEPIGKFHFRADQDSTPVEQTEVKLLWDDEFLYIAFIVEDSHINVGSSATIFNSNAGVSADDCVEFFWIPGTADTLFYQFEISAVGTPLTQFRHKRSTSANARILFNIPPYIAQTFQGTVNDNSDVDTGYTMEIAMRFSDYPVIPYINTITNLQSFLTTMYAEFPRHAPQPGDTWRANFNRVSLLGDRTTRRYSMWSPNVLTHKWDTENPKPLTGSWFHCPHDFGFLHFSAEPVR